mmetsp:Transcript_32051/g.102095  ORF Transcript_32051/g.102095 Transcript_32051/m.102095 type:complete len:124 (-) Transcript_32051:2102-2473(-)
MSTLQISSCMFEKRGKCLSRSSSCTKIADMCVRSGLKVKNHPAGLEVEEPIDCDVFNDYTSIFIFKQLQRSRKHGNEIAPSCYASSITSEGMIVVDGGYRLVRFMFQDPDSPSIDQAGNFVRH